MYKIIKKVHDAPPNVATILGKNKPEMMKNMIASTIKPNVIDFFELFFEKIVPIKILPISIPTVKED
jgi:hypothetical protein